MSVVRFLEEAQKSALSLSLSLSLFLTTALLSVGRHVGWYENEAHYFKMITQVKRRRRKWSVLLRPLLFDVA